MGIINKKDIIAKNKKIDILLKKDVSDNNDNHPKPCYTDFLSFKEIKEQTHDKCYSVNNDIIHDNYSAKNTNSDKDYIGKKRKSTNNSKNVIQNLIKDNKISNLNNLEKKSCISAEMADEKHLEELETKLHFRSLKKLSVNVKIREPDTLSVDFVTPGKYSLKAFDEVDCFSKAKSNNFEHGILNTLDGSKPNQDFNLLNNDFFLNSNLVGNCKKLDLFKLNDDNLAFNIGNNNDLYSEFIFNF
jgi:hypothetical protein